MSSKLQIPLLKVGSAHRLSSSPLSLGTWNQHSDGSPQAPETPLRHDGAKPGPSGMAYLRRGVGGVGGGAFPLLRLLQDAKVLKEVTPFPGL